MWITTNHGFFSIVQDREDPRYLWVRARARKDLESIFQSQDIIKSVDADYLYRVKVDRHQAASFLIDEIWDIDYFNFKNSVRDRQGERRERTYHMVWADLLEIEAEEREATWPVPDSKSSVPFASELYPRKGNQPPLPRALLPKADGSQLDLEMPSPSTSRSLTRSKRQKRRGRAKTNRENER